MNPLRVGVIGLGEVAQIIHLPILSSMSNRYALTAICDISPSLLTEMGQRYGVPEQARFLDFEDLAKRDDLDVVFVLNSDEYHADSAIAAMRSGKHVMVEKPMCLTMAEAERMIRERDAAGVSLMVGYMRRYAPAFREAVDRVRAMERINYVRVRDIIGQNRLIIDQVEDVVRPDDFPAEAGRDRQQRAARLVSEAIGEASPELTRAYRLLCGLSSHDLSAMRELIGMPERVVSASQWHGGSFLHVVMDYGEFQAVLETGVDSQVRFDAHIEVYGETSSLRIEYDTPYIRHLPTRLYLEETEGERFTETVLRPTYADPYTRELEYLHDALVNGTGIKTSAEDFTDDLRLFQWIIAALRQSTASPNAPAGAA
ncbi:MAG: GH109 [uncultured Thermomicrobiales bacterium]|uniref:GH109 n=1 Tax=uncultured Thermomicrobiales bacterium TaxID=1645740 RepID=A0A6J4VST2_9BACT|nr:MAG: GH109 [uncultured Thermomicrobiales bacterium]